MTCPAALISTLIVFTLTNDALHPISRMPEFKICAVRVERADRESLPDGEADAEAKAAAPSGRSPAAGSLSAGRTADSAAQQRARLRAASESGA
jgi:assimilatory nitrate reductase catalytic subunit